MERAETDLDHAKIAEAVVEHGRQDWLLRRIEHDLGGSSAGQIARALTLAGLLDRSPAADAFWAGRLAASPAAGWLSDVHGWARNLYLKNGWARHWLDCFLEERDRDQAFGCHLLFVACADHRARAWSPRRVEAYLRQLATRLAHPLGALRA